MRAWLCNAPGFYGTLCIDSPRCPAATQCSRLHALYGGPRHTGRARRLAGGDEARGRRDPFASHAGRRAVARDSTDTRDGPVATDRAQPPRPALADGVTDDLPQWRLRLCTTRTGLRGPWAWRPPSRARQMANAVSGVVRQRTGITS